MKPTIFFSHSSLDSDRIKPIKEYILNKTGNAINIFMSSDGASIPFGKNWLKEIEDALTNCKIMFVWITPNALKSNWLYFESGYVYSRGIKVVPIGFDGIKLEDFPAPLNVLQGFNINSSASLNNILGIINKEFGLTFPDIFDEAFYNKQIIKYSTNNSAELLKYVEVIQCKFHPQIKISETGIITINNQWINIFENILMEKGEIYTKYEEEEFFGIGFKAYTRFSDTNRNIKYPEFFIDPLALNNFWKILSELHFLVYDKNFFNIILNVKLKPTYKLPEDHYIISSRLLNTEVDFNTLEPHVLYRFRNIQFRINIYMVANSWQRELILIVNQNNKEIIPLTSLLNLLIKQSIIRKKEE